MKIAITVITFTDFNFNYTHTHIHSAQCWLTLGDLEVEQLLRESCWGGRTARPERLRYSGVMVVQEMQSADSGLEQGSAVAAGCWLQDACRPVLTACRWCLAARRLLDCCPLGAFWCACGFASVLLHLREKVGAWCYLMHHFCWSLPPPSRHPFSKGLGLQGEAQVVSCAMVAIKALLLVLYEDKSRSCTWLLLMVWCMSVEGRVGNGVRSFLPIASSAGLTPRSGIGVER